MIGGGGSVRVGTSECLRSVIGSPMVRGGGLLRSVTTYLVDVFLFHKKQYHRSGMERWHLFFANFTLKGYLYPLYSKIYFTSNCEPDCTLKLVKVTFPPEIIVNFAPLVTVTLSTVSVLQPVIVVLDETV